MYNNNFDAQAIAESINTGTYSGDLAVAKQHGPEVVKWTEILWGYYEEQGPKCSFCKKALVFEEGQWCDDCEDAADEAVARLEDSECECCGSKGIRGLCHFCAEYEDFDYTESTEEVKLNVVTILVGGLLTY